MKQHPTLSAVIITYNEEKNIERCLKSLEDVVDEVIVVDSFSSDKTEQICEQYKVIFHKHPFSGYCTQKNIALDFATGDYILSLDADEVLSQELRTEILNVKHQGFGASGYRFNRLTHYVNQYIYHCSWYPDSKIRLIKRGHAKWMGENIHESLRLISSGKIEFLKGDLYHYSYNSISEHINQTNKFTTLSAQILFNKGKRSSLLRIMTAGPFKFFRDYILKRGFLDGGYGFIICFINSLSVMLKYAKLRDLERGHKID